MDKLTGIDRAYVGLESRDVPADFLSIVTLDPSTAPGGHDWERFRAEAAARVVAIPALVRRLVSAPLGIAPDQWVDDPDFDVDRHLHRVACPAPGDLAALQHLALEVAGGTLERDRPLWAMWYVEGMADGGAALLFKIHHAAIDGMGAMQAFATLFDTEPRPVPDDLEPATVEGQRVPSGPEMIVRTVPDQVGAPLRAARGVLELAGAQVRSLADVLLGGATPDASTATGRPAGGDDPTGDTPPDPSLDWIPAPTTVLNRRPDSLERSLAVTTASLQDVKDIARAAGATVNDVVLAVVAGALRTYLQGRGELPTLPMRAVCPVNVRTEDDDAGGNAFTAMFVPLPTHLDDPHARLSYVAEATAVRKPTGGGSGPSPARTALELLDTLPSTAFSVIGSLASGGALTAAPPLANVVMSNVMGPDATLYLAGARITHMHARTMAGPGIGAMIHCTSYAGQLDFGVTALRDLVPDPEGITDLLPAEIAALRG